MSFNFDQEKKLEQKYQGVLTYIDAKHFLEKTPYTAAKINGAIKRFCNSDDGYEKPNTFIEMEPFVNDLADFWLDANPEVHEHGENVLRSALSNYIAFAIVWKAKAKASNIIDPELMRQAGQMIVMKNGLAGMIKLVNSRIAHDPCPNKEIYKDLSTVIADALYIALPLSQKMTAGELTLPEGVSEDDVYRVIGGLFSGNPAVVGVSNTLKQIEYKEAS